jgi:hypothetical protein
MWINTLAAVAITSCCFASAGLAAGLPPNISYNADGVFATFAASGVDRFELAGEPFHVSVVVSEATLPAPYPCQPTTTCIYPNVPVVATVESGVLPGTALPLASGTLGTLTLTVGTAGTPDVLKVVFPQTVAGIPITITAKIYLPGGTIMSAAIQPFTKPVALNSSSGEVTYADSLNSTTLDFASGMLQTRKD